MTIVLAKGGAELRSQAIALERHLSRVARECTAAQRSLTEARDHRRQVAWQIENLELRLQERFPTANPVGPNDAARHQQEERNELTAWYDAELANMRQRLACAVDFNSELRRRCGELEQEACVSSRT